MGEYIYSIYLFNYLEGWSWVHLVELYNRSKTASGLSLLPKLCMDHIYLTSYSKMRVNLAVQVRSMWGMCLQIYILVC